jgi:hypothetical protein
MAGLCDASLAMRVALFFFLTALTATLLALPYADLP